MWAPGKYFPREADLSHQNGPCRDDAAALPSGADVASREPISGEGPNGHDREPSMIREEQAMRLAHHWILVLALLVGPAKLAKITWVFVAFGDEDPGRGGTRWCGVYRRGVAKFRAMVRCASRVGRANMANTDSVG
jgi:hypothetical protein